MALSPTVADGLAGCSDAQMALKSLGAATCPAASKIGTVEVTTPLLDDPLTGEVFLGTQKSEHPQSGEMYRMSCRRGLGHAHRAPGLGRAGDTVATNSVTPTLAFQPPPPLHAPLARGLVEGFTRIWPH